MVKVTGDAIGIERFAILDSTKPLPKGIFAVEGVWGGTYTARVRLVPIPQYDTRGVLCSETRPDFVKLGAVLDMIRDTDLAIDLSAVPGWHDKGIGG